MLNEHVVFAGKSLIQERGMSALLAGMQSMISGNGTKPGDSKNIAI